MNRKLIAATFVGASIVAASAASAQAADGAYPPVAPTSSATNTTAPPVAPSTDTDAKNNDTQVLGTKAADATDTSTLPNTGAEWMATAAIGGGLLVGGTGLVVAARRRQGA